MLKLLRQEARKAAAKKEQTSLDLQRPLSVGGRIQDAPLGQQRFVPVRDYDLLSAQLLRQLQQQGRSAVTEEQQFAA